MLKPTLRPVCLLAIRLYQRYLSPYKDFVCAYRVHTGQASCSALGFRAIRRRGVVSGLAILRQRTALCGLVHRQHRTLFTRPPAAQRGDCDCDLPCDLGCDASDCASCDWPRRDRSHTVPDRKARRLQRFGRGDRDKLPEGQAGPPSGRGSGPR